MANSSAASPEHVAGDWYSVPELRLRDHRFAVPLDYSADRNASQRISVFAREVVAGTHDSELSFSFQIAVNFVLFLIPRLRLFRNGTRFSRTLDSYPEIKR